MEDSEVVFEQLSDTAETMEQEGLLPDGHNKKMELRDTQFQDGTLKSQGSLTYVARRNWKQPEGE